MKDIEIFVVNAVYKALAEKYPNIPVSSDISIAPAKFPCVYIEQSDSFTSTNRRDSTKTDNYDVVIFDVNVFSSKPKGKREEAKAIMSIIDDELRLMGMTRSSLEIVSIPNPVRARLFARYECEVGLDNVIYQRR